MPTRPTNLNPDASFGELLKYLRRQAQMTQRDLGLAVGYTEGHVCRLERNQRLPDPVTLTALFVPALGLEDQPAQVERLLALAGQARGGPAEPAALPETTHEETTITLGALDDIPAAPTHAVARPVALARLREALAREGATALVGMPGMGKTTLAAEYAREQAAAGRPVFWLTLTPRMTDIAPTLLRQLALFVFAASGDETVLPVAEANAGAAPLPLERQMALVGAGLGRLPAKHSQRGPALLCLDDAHLAQGDEATLGVLRGLAMAQWLLAGREALALSTAAKVPLAGLETAEQRELADRLGARLEASLAERLQRKTGGSPFLLRLAVGQMLGRGAAPRQLIEHLETLPEAAAYLLDTFLVQLSPAASRLASLIAVFRQPVNVYAELLVELGQAADGPYDVAAAAGELQRRLLIDDPAQAALHPLVRDHLYTTLVGDLPRRRRLHKAAAEWYELAQGDWTEAAYHYAHAGQLTQAADVLADRGAELFSRGEALAGTAVVDEILSRARQRRAETPDLRRRLLTLRGDLLVFGPRAAEAEANYREALGLAAQAGVRATIVWRLAQSLIQRGQAAEALERVRATAAELAPGEGLLRAQLAAAEGWALLLLARYEEAEQAARQSLELAEPLAGLAPRAVDEVRARSQHVLGVAHSIRGLPNLALDHWQRATEAARRAGLRQVEYRCLMNMGVLLYHHLDDTTGALAYFFEAVEKARALGDTFLVGRIRMNMGQAYFALGELDSAQNAVSEAVELRRQMGDVSGVAAAENLRTIIEVALGQVAAARARAGRLIQETAAMGDQRMRNGFIDTLALTQLVNGETEAAIETLREVLAAAGAEAKTMTDIHNHLALALLARGEVEAARLDLEQSPAAEGSADTKFERELIAGAVELASGREEAAKVAFAGVAERAGALGYKLQVRAARRLLGAIERPVSLGEMPGLVYLPE